VLAQGDDAHAAELQGNTATAPPGAEPPQTHSNPHKSSAEKACLSVFSPLAFG